METTNNNPAEVPVPVADLASSVPGTGTPKESPSTGGLGAGAPAAAPAATRPAPTGTESTAPPAPAPVVGGMAPVTKGNVQGGWNRFAGYKPGEANKKKNDRRDGGGRGRR